MALFKKNKKSEKEIFLDFLNEYKKHNIPKNFNQIKLMKELLNEDLDHYICISNRTDGKSINYIGFLLAFAKTYDIKLLLLTRMFTVRDSYQMLIDKIATFHDFFNPQEFTYVNTQHYRNVYYQGTSIAIITDLNSASNLKYKSNFLSDYPIMIYDEFLTLEGDYLPYEWEYLKTIYGSIDRNRGIPFIKFPKIIYLGNAVNFSSPILSALNIYNRLEKQEINTVTVKDNIAMEITRNDNANVTRNLRAFNEKDDPMASGEFLTNDYGLATENDRELVYKNMSKVIVKLRDRFLSIIYNLDYDKIILAIVGYQDTYDYNQEIKDNRENSTYLKDSYYRHNMAKKHVKGLYLYDNNFSKDYITENGTITQLNIRRLIRETESNKVKIDSADLTEQKYINNYERRTLKNIANKFLKM